MLFNILKSFALDYQCIDCTNNQHKRYHDPGIEEHAVIVLFCQGQDQSAITDKSHHRCQNIILQRAVSCN